MSWLGLSGPSPRKTYREIIRAARNIRRAIGREINLKLPFPDPQVDALKPKAFIEYLREEIGQSDAVLTILSSPGIAVGYESHLASMLRKPQLILVPRSVRPPRWLQALEYVIDIRRLRHVELSAALKDLAAAVEETKGLAYE